MIAIIVLLLFVIALIIGLSVAGNSTVNDVTTSNAVGQIGTNAILGCTFTPDPKQASNVLWEKDGMTGNVYKYENGKASLKDQNSQFTSRTALFLDQLTSGNASLKISNVQLADAGVYKCTITNSKGTGSNKLTLNVGAFSPLTLTNTSGSTLQCSSSSWYPSPTVSWLNSNGTNINASTQIVSGLGVTVDVLSTFSGAVLEEQYTCIIQNNLAKAQGSAKFTILGLKTDGRLDVTGSAAILSPPVFLLWLLLLIGYTAAI
ncbi:V-set domain-containing T-cell activation inhibitor 1-like isoform X2 [Hyperolius riggenbachi]